MEAGWSKPRKSIPLGGGSAEGLDGSGEASRRLVVNPTGTSDSDRRSTDSTGETDSISQPACPNRTRKFFTGIDYYS